MKFLASSGSTALRRPGRALRLAVALPLWCVALSVAAEESAKPPTTLRLENPEDRATLTESISNAIMRAQAGRSGKSIRNKGPAQITVQGAPAKAKPRKPAKPKPAQAMPPATDSAFDPAASRRYIEARAATLAAQSPATPAPLPDPQQVPWSYSGDTGAQAWGQLYPAFAACAQGLQQSPIDITQNRTVIGPAEALHMEGAALTGTVVHRGHSIVVEVASAHSLALRGTRWRLQRLEFHHPAEERMDFQNFPMSADLVYQSPAGQWAVLSVPLQWGAANPLIDRIWANMPLQAQDRVPLPESGAPLQQLLPQDMRYYQYLGSLTTPPCTEGVLRLVLKKPGSVSIDQWRLLTQMTPPNARPARALHERIVRNAR